MANPFDTASSTRGRPKANPFDKEPPKRPFDATPQGIALNTVKGLPRALSEVVGQPQLRAYAGLAGLFGRTLTPETPFQKELYGTDKPLTLTRSGRETLGQDPDKPTERPFAKAAFPAIGLFAAGSDLIPGGKPAKDAVTQLAPYVINAKGKELPNLKNVLDDVKGFIDRAKFDRIEIQNVGKKKDTHTLLLDRPGPARAEDPLPTIPESEPAASAVAAAQKRSLAALDDMEAGQQARQTPATTLRSLTQGEDGPAWASLLKGYSRNRPKEAKVTLIDYAATPEFVLEKIGMQKGAQLLQDAKDIYRTTKAKEIDRIVEWKKRVEAGGRPHSATRIFRYLDGDARYAKGEMTETEIEVAQEIKAYLKEWADRLKLPEENRLSNYITHIFEKGAIDPKTGEKWDDPDLAVIMENTPAKSVYNPFLEKRENKQGYKEDVWAALDAYVKRGSRKEAFDPALEEIEAAAHQIDDKAYAYVTALTHRINMRPTFIDEAMDDFVKERFGTKFTDRPVAHVSQKIRQVFYRGTLGLNVSSALRNLSQFSNTYAKLGEKHTVVGYTKLFTRLVTRNLKELYDEGILDDSINQDRRIGVYKSTLEKADPYLFSLFDLAEKINRGAAYYGAKSKGLSNGLSPENATRFAKRVVRETQFAFGNVDAPLALSSDVVKTLVQLQSYNVRQAEFLLRMVKNKEYAGLVRWSVANLAFIYTVGRLFGMKPEQIIPLFGLESPLLNATSGATGLLTENADDREEAASQLKRAGFSAVPAGVQLRKTVQGLSAYSEGKDVTPAGNTRFKIEQTPANAIRAALFGKSALPAAQEYYRGLNNRGKKKPKKKARNPL